MWESLGRLRERVGRARAAQNVVEKRTGEKRSEVARPALRYYSKNERLDILFYIITIIIIYYFIDHIDIYLLLLLSSPANTNLTVSSLSLLYRNIARIYSIRDNNN